MSGANMAWAYDQDIPPIPKFLLVAIADCCGMARELDVDHARYHVKCGITPDKILDVLMALEKRRVLEIIACHEDYTTVYLKYPIRDYELPSQRGQFKQPPCPRFLYVASSEIGLVKVGITTSLESRIESLRSTSGLAVKLCWSSESANPLARDYESKLLRQFAASRKVGEWLETEIEDVILAAIEITGSDGTRHV